MIFPNLKKAVKESQTLVSDSFVVYIQVTNTRGFIYKIEPSIRRHISSVL
uniref:Uncharacterized protein n=1 Tax=Vibrio splendidus TaxID=29497 RepID=A0A0H3ZKN1_VIBSP|nr:hypothetical protein [Vibrio splendidus]